MDRRKGELFLAKHISQYKTGFHHPYGTEYLLLLKSISQKKYPAGAVPDVEKDYSKFTCNFLFSLAAS